MFDLFTDFVVVTFDDKGYAILENMSLNHGEQNINL